ncbi:MAG: SpoIIE family protein phosphatase, partial [Gemmatimonadales bacterium]
GTNTLNPLVARLLDRERETLALAKQLQARYEEIELLYTISEILGRTTRLESAAQTILEEVSHVVGAQRASIFLHDHAGGVLRPVASIGKPLELLEPVPVDAASSIIAGVFRTRQPVAYDPRQEDEPFPGVGDAERGYRGSAFLSVPITYRGGESDADPIGVLSLTDRLGTDGFSGGERRLAGAVANQVGAAIEHTRLVERDLVRQRMDQELELAYRLQMKLLPAPHVLGPGADLAARCVPARGVGGDFYYFLRLPQERIGVMLGDVSSHGYPAALIMAHVLAAAGIHAEWATSPDVTLRELFKSVRDELAETEMHLALFYGVVDRAAGRLRYANAGHPYAFRLRAAGEPERLGATCPPLGLADESGIRTAEVAWTPESDLLLLVSDGVVEAADAGGATFGEDRVLAFARKGFDTSPAAIVDAILEEVGRFEGGMRDDRTLLVLRY